MVTQLATKAETKVEMVLAQVVAVAQTTTLCRAMVVLTLETVD
jgi:hypothetical protein